MTNEELFAIIGDQLRAQSGAQAVVEISDAALGEIEREQALETARRFGGAAFMRLPARDVHFFEWLKTAAPEVWEDLWGEPPASEADEELPEIREPYLVGVRFLPELLRRDRGFPICDLVGQPNFYFTIKNFNAEEAKPFVEAALARAEAGAELSLGQIFMLETRSAPIDVWRFAYLYRISVEEAKQTALQLVADGLLRHAPTREEMSEFFAFEE